ncbi:aminotransferase class V-fold PLP-dependent enzyme [Streptomyces sp. YC504]|uniref:Aminotransferase class V-fold PLP-dependent enzyme n=1 Tax=Streptomyces mesophilus TaxID=1775132 RepID=A0A6G4XB25_9ACTN|nr:aminotransferase class V-fold PLP-dependent enzyme [Streptomyces mesophilus]NGO74453.1 aminotransferase class V-fold PLP-dependent enzyme [Streptomyces mesophilus]
MKATSHGGTRVHLDPAGQGRMPDAARAAFTHWARHDDRYGSCELEEYVEDVVRDELALRLSTALRAPVGDTALFTGAADAFAAFTEQLPLGPGDRVWTTPYEGHEQLTALYALRDRTRCDLTVVPLRENGDLDLEWMGAHLDDSVALVSVTHVPAGCGIVNPVEDIGRMLQAHRGLYAVDASYSVGQLPLDVSQIGCDLLTADGWRYLGGPQAIGFASFTPELKGYYEPSDGMRPRPEPHGAAVVALNAALAELPQVFPDQELADAVRDMVVRAPGVEVIAPGGVQSAMLAFRHERLSAGRMRKELADRGVVVRKVVGQETPLYLPGRGITTAVRVSLSHDTTTQDIARFGEALDDVLAATYRSPAAVAPRRQHEGATILRFPVRPAAGEETGALGLPHGR